MNRENGLPVAEALALVCLSFYFSVSRYLSLTGFVLERRFARACFFSGRAARVA